MCVRASKRERGGCYQNVRGTFSVLTVFKRQKGMKICQFHEVLLDTHAHTHIRKPIHTHIFICR